VNRAQAAREAKALPAERIWQVRATDDESSRESCFPGRRRTGQDQETGPNSAARRCSTARGQAGEYPSRAGPGAFDVAAASTSPARAQFRLDAGSRNFAGSGAQASGRCRRSGQSNETAPTAGSRSGWRCSGPARIPARRSWPRCCGRSRSSSPAGPPSAIASGPGTDRQTGCRSSGRTPGSPAR